jgi:adenosylhomocysteine nucleosidase
VSAVLPGFAIVVCGLRAEARLAHGPKARTIAGGGDHGQVETEIRRAIAEGGSCLLSFGFAGGLDPSLVPGTLLLADTVVAGDQRFVTDRAMTGRLQAVLPEAMVRTIAGSDVAVGSVAAKRALRDATAAAAVDMESHLVARAAAAAGLPFAVLRAIADPATRALPPSAIAGISPDGRTNLVAVLRRLVGRPVDLGPLLGTTLDAARAFGALRQCRRKLGPGLGLGPDSSPFPRQGEGVA